MNKQKILLLHIIIMWSKKGVNMRITSINNYYTAPNFSGENKAKNKLKNAAGAAAIALAASVPSEEINSQIFYPQIYPNTLITPLPVVTNPVPNCFIVGDNRNVNYNKSTKEVFDEIDKNENGVLSAKEVVRTERNNWNKYNIYYPFTTAQMMQTEAQFEQLSKAYNEDDSNPNTINFNEYKSIMKDYMKAKQVNNFIKLFTLPGILYPPPPPHHHHHRHDAPPPPHHRHHR